MNNSYLLSLFPLNSSSDYARVTFTVLEDESLPEMKAFTATRDTVVSILQVLGMEDVDPILMDLDEGDCFRIAITAHQALVTSESMSRSIH